MKSYEVIRSAVDEPGVKAVAAALKVSPALVYKWCEPPADSEDPDQSGAKNPLDRVREMYMLTKDIRLVRWLCNEAGGFYVSNPVPEIRKSRDETIRLRRFNPRDPTGRTSQANHDLAVGSGGVTEQQPKRLTVRHQSGAFTSGSQYPACPSHRTQAVRDPALRRRIECGV